MTRRLFTIFCGLSLLLCVASLVLWVRAWMANDLILKAHIGNNGYLLTLRQGRIELTGIWDFADSASWLNWNIPCWLVLLLTAVLPVLLFISVVRRRSILSARMKNGSCLKCGYSLTGNVSGTCPECGMEIAAKTP